MYCVSGEDEVKVVGHHKGTHTNRNKTEDGEESENQMFACIKRILIIYCVPDGQEVTDVPSPRKRRRDYSESG